jgi:hypothetical protein
MIVARVHISITNDTFYMTLFDKNVRVRVILLVFINALQHVEFDLEPPEHKCTKKATEERVFHWS